MSLSNLPTGTVSSHEAEQSEASVSGPQERGVKGSDVPADPTAGQRGSERQRVDELEAELEAMRAERNRLQKEQNEIVTRYEHILRQERERSKQTTTRSSARTAEPPAGDTVRLKVARLFGLR